MTISCDSVMEPAKGFSFVKQCDVIRNGMLRMETFFTYPEGSSIDLFLGHPEDGSQDWVLTDLGYTVSYLLDMRVKPWATKKRKQIVNDICRILQVRQTGGELKIEFSDEQLKDLPLIMMRLGQACVRVADLAMTVRLRSPAFFREEFEEFIESTDVRYEPSVSLIGRFGKEVQVDFRVYGRGGKSLLHTISTGNKAAAHARGLEVFRTWYDLSPFQTEYQFLTVFDSTNDVFQDADRRRLETVSLVLGFPAELDQLREALAA